MLLLERTFLTAAAAVAAAAGVWTTGSAKGVPATGSSPWRGRCREGGRHRRRTVMNRHRGRTDRFR